MCNAIENLLVHERVAKDILPQIKQKLDEKNVELRCCPKALAILKDAVAATEEDYYTEFLDYIMAVKVVETIDEAIAHINKYGSLHSECIEMCIRDSISFKESMFSNAFPVPSTTQS